MYFNVDRPEETFPLHPLHIDTQLYVNALDASVAPVRDFNPRQIVFAVLDSFFVSQYLIVK